MSYANLHTLLFIHHFLHHTKLAYPTPSNKGCYSIYLSVIPGLSWVFMELLYFPVNRQLHQQLHQPTVVPPSLPSFYLFLWARRSPILWDAWCLVAERDVNLSQSGSIVPAGMFTANQWEYGHALQR